MNQDLEILKYLAKKDKQIEKLYEELIYQLSDVSTKISQIELEDFFSFDDYPEVKEKVDDVLASYSTEQQKIITDGIKDSVKMSFASNAATLGAFTRFSAQALSDMRESVTQAFISSRMNPKEGLSLSQKVWNYTNQAKSEFEAALSELLEDGLSQGMSAEELGRMVRDKLRIPEMVYRRYHVKKLTATGKKDVIEWRRKIVDSEGKVRYIKEDLEKVGHGVYRSSRKNALRLTATEINMAYRYADNERWQREPFVIGFRIQLSGNHTLNGQPFYDICDDLVGDYPKTFRWAGWHPRCRCIATSILISKEEMMRISDLPEEEYNNYISPNLITKMPQKYGEYVDKNRDRILASMDKGTTPYWVKDNYKNGDIRKGLYWENKKGKQFKTEEQKADIQAAWDERKRKNAIRTAAENRHANRDAVAIQKAWDERKARYAKLKSTATNVWMVALDEPWVNSTNLQFLIHRKKYHLLEDEYRKVAKEVAAVKKQKAQLSTLIPDIGTWQNLFSYDDLKAVYDSVEKKLAQWEMLPLDQQKKKLTFEIIDYLGGNMGGVQQKYATWKVSQAAYAKQLGIVEAKIYKQAIKSEVNDMIKWSISHSKATSVKKNVHDILDLMNDDNSDLQLLKVKFEETKKHISTLEAQAAKRAAKKKGITTQSTSFDADAYTQQRKNAAMWAKDTREADDKLRDKCGEVWINATSAEREAIHGYTGEYHNINEPLRGLTYIGSSTKANRGLQRIPHIESIIDKSTYDFDMWVQRGDGLVSLKKFGLDNYDFASDAEIKALVGKTGIEGAFWSAGVAKGKGFSGKVIFNIYMPKGTKAMYCEPFSAFGLGNGKNWDGISKQNNFGHESEILIQRGTKFKITKVEKGANGVWYIDLDVVEQNPVPFPYVGGYPFK